MASLRLDLIARYLRPHRRTVLMGAGSLVVVNIFSVIIPLEVREVIDNLQESFEISEVLTQAIWIILLATIMGLARLLSRQLVFGVGRQVEVELRQRLFDHMLTQEPSWVQEIGSGEVISRATSDVENIRRLLGFTILSLTNTLLAYGFTLPAMFGIDPWLSLAAIALYPLMLGTVSLFGGRMVRQRKNQQKALSKLSELIQEDLSGISAIKIYGQESSEQNAFKARNKKYRDSAIDVARTASTLFPLLQGISSVSLLLLIALGSGQLEKGALSIGGLVALILYVERLVFPTALLGFTLNTFQVGQVSLERIEELLQRLPRIHNTNSPTILNEPINGRVEARELTIKYEGAKHNVLDNLNFTINPGELVAIVGPVGCGKTTLARAIARMVEVPAKQLFLDGYDVNNLLLEDLRKNVAVVPQEGYLFTTSLANNLRYGEPNASLKRVEDSAIQARLIEDIRGFPDGFQTLVGERGITLSGGQRQRTALGRAILVTSPILVLDDALASVDNETASQIISEIRRSKGRTIILISHQLSAAAACDRILVLENGRLIQQGHHNQLIQVEGTYRRMWEREKATEKMDSIL